MDAEEFEQHPSLQPKRPSDALSNHDEFVSDMNFTPRLAYIAALYSLVPGSLATLHVGLIGQQQHKTAWTSRGDKARHYTALSSARANFSARTET